MKLPLVLLLLIIPSLAVSLDYDELYTAPATIQDKGFVYITFCSRSNEARTFHFTPNGFAASPYRLTLDFSGTSTIPDCKQAVIQVSSSTPGMFTLDADSGSDEWSIPVEFAKPEPLGITLSQSVIYTGYDTVELRVNGQGRDAWLTVDSPVVGTSSIYRSNLPATFPLTFHFTSAGFQEVPVTISYDRNNRTVTQTYTLGVRVEEAPIKIGRELRVPSDGYANLTVPMELPETIYSGTVSLSSPCLEGSTSSMVENFRSGNVTFQVKGSCDPGIYAVNVTAMDFQTTVPLHVYGPEGYEIFINTDQRDSEHRMDVIIANKGSQTMKALSVRLLDGNYRAVREGSFIGDLEFGDFDSVELAFVPLSNPVDVNYKISYTMAGDRKELVKAFHYEYPEASGGSFWYVVLVLAGVGVWYVKYRRPRR
jgi:hypothetical protein